MHLRLPLRRKHALDTGCLEAQISEPVLTALDGQKNTIVMKGSANADVGAFRCPNMRDCSFDGVERAELWNEVKEKLRNYLVWKYDRSLPCRFPLRS
jgi:hypothetical protein